MRDKNTAQVHLDREVMLKAKVVAAVSNQHLREYLDRIVTPVVQTDFQHVLEREVAERGDA